jgi:hypothetical protein
MEVKTTLKVIDQAAIPEQPGVTEGQTMRRLVGCPEVPTDRVRVGFASYKAGTIEDLHWHPIEAFYYVLGGHAIVRDIEGNEYHVGDLRAARHRGRARVGGQGGPAAAGGARHHGIRSQAAVHGGQADQALLHRARRAGAARRHELQVALLGSGRTR